MQTSLSFSQLARLQKRLAERSVTLDLTPAALAFLAERGYDPAFGAKEESATVLTY